MVCFGFIARQKERENESTPEKQLSTRKASAQKKKKKRLRHHERVGVPQIHLHPRLFNFQAFSGRNGPTTSKLFSPTTQTPRGGKKIMTGRSHDMRK